MRAYVLSVVWSLVTFSIAWSQLKIETCYEKAEANYPLIQAYELIEKSKEYNLSNASKGYLPQVMLSAKATYQSDVTKVPIDIPGVKGLSKDQYGATIELNQTVWDGGHIRSKKEELLTQSEVEGKNIDMILYTIRERVNQLFFGVLLYDGMLQQNEIYQKELQRNLNLVSAYIQNGIANQSDKDAVRVEQVKAVQHHAELTHNRQAYLAMLSALMGEAMSENITLEMPACTDEVSTVIQRPELAYYDASLRNLDALKKGVNANLMPRFNLFITGGYGKPGLNMLESNFSAYYLGGIRMVWNFGGLYTRKNSLRNIEVNKSRIDVEREAFLFNTRLDMTNSDYEIRKMTQLIQTDEEIVRLRTSIRESAETKLANGTLSVLDLMKEVNAEQMARQEQILHNIQLVQAKYQLKYITNN